MSVAESMRIAWVVAGVLVAAASATSNPPPQAMPPRSQQAPGATAPQYGPCEYACGQVSRCNLAPYDGCVAECRRAGTEQQPNGREELDVIARSSCEQLSAMARTSPNTSAPATSAQPATPPPPAASTPPPSAPPSSTPPSTGGSMAAGRWRSGDHVSYTNAAMVSADIYLDVAVASDGTFRGSWARYVCFAGAYGIMSCGKGQSEGTASGRLDANGTGAIDLQNLGRSALAWRTNAAGEIALELPRDWQGSAVLFRSTLKR